MSDKRYPSGQADHISLRLDNEQVPLKADGSDVVTIIAEIVDKRGTVKRLNNSVVRFEIEGELFYPTLLSIVPGPEQSPKRPDTDSYPRKPLPAGGCSGHGTIDNKVG